MGIGNSTSQLSNSRVDFDSDLVGSRSIFSDNVGNRQQHSQSSAVAESEISQKYGRNFNWQNNLYNVHELSTDRRPANRLSPEKQEWDLPSYSEPVPAAGQTTGSSKASFSSSNSQSVSQSVKNGRRSGGETRCRTNSVLAQY